MKVARHDYLRDMTPCLTDNSHHLYVGIYTLCALISLSFRLLCFIFIFLDIQNQGALSLPSW